MMNIKRDAYTEIVDYYSKRLERRSVLRLAKSLDTLETEELARAEVTCCVLSWVLETIRK